MKIGDVKVGEEYGAIDEPSRRYRHDLPRKVTVLAIESVPETYWKSGGFTGERGTRNVRKLRVRFEDEATASRSYFRGGNEIAATEKGTEALIEARFLVGPWSGLRREVHAKIAERDAQANAIAATTARINALLPKKLQDEYHGVQATQMTHPRKYIRVDVRLDGDVLETILKLAEIGKSAQEQVAQAKPVTA